jgi:hypothetical protein
VQTWSTKAKALDLAIVAEAVLLAHTDMTCAEIYIGRSDLLLDRE